VSNVKKKNIGANIYVRAKMSMCRPNSNSWLIKLFMFFLFCVLHIHVRINHFYLTNNVFLLPPRPWLTRLSRSTCDLKKVVD
jgi:hypothetical protein